MMSVVANSPNGSSYGSNALYIKIIQVDTSITINGNTLTASPNVIFISMDEL
jgi:hypothetical protein